MITDPDVYFERGCGRCARFDTKDCATRIWADTLAPLRQICRATGLREEAKWGHPCYTRNGRNIAIIGAFRDQVRLSFFNAALLKDPANVLEKQGPNTQHADMIRLTSPDDVDRLADTIAAYLHEATGYADAGIKPVKVVTELALPEELTDALDSDPTLAEAFHALTPGRQKSYVINLNGAKKPETRVARILKFRDKIIAGKGAQER